jgi:glycerol uptake facilitator-like aquaporin
MAFAYILTQLAASTTAAAICHAVFPAAAVAQANLGIPLPAAWASPATVLTLEFVMTFLLMTAIFGTAVDKRGPMVKIGGFGIGLTVAFDILAGGAVTGASMNPARSFGPALVQGYWAWHGYYWVAPIAGAVTAALIYQHLILNKE